MSYEEAVRRLYALRKSGMRLHRGRMDKALAMRGHPERSLPVIHIAGTNGKGSTAAMVAAIGRAAGLSTGLFTSPHLHRFVERIQLNGRPLGEKEAARRLADIWAAQEGDARFPALSFFETVTLLALEVFRDRGCELVVLETGLGGRLDATNVVPKPLATAITHVALDHQKILGSTLGRIATEKAGILKAGSPFLSTVRQKAAREAIAKAARRLDVKPQWIDAQFGHDEAPGGVLIVRVGRRRFSDLRLQLKGAHQHDNAALAVALCVRAAGRRRRLKALADPTAIRKGLKSVRWPGRLERLGREPLVLLDAAHNPNGCAALASYLKDTMPQPTSGRRILIFAAMEDKPFDTMLATLAPHVDALVVSPLNMARAATPSQLATTAGELGLRVRRTRSVSQALQHAKQAAGRDGQVVVAGSIFLVAEVRARVLGCRSEPLIGL